MTPPQIIILAGPNGAGKSTLSRLPELAGLPFLNADDIEKDQASGPLKAGKTLIAKLKKVASQRINFVVATTLSGKWLASHLVAFREVGYQVHISYVWINSEDMSVSRVASRVAKREAIIFRSLTFADATSEAYEISGAFMCPCQTRRKCMIILTDLSH